MKPNSPADRIIISVVVILSLVALLLVLVSPAGIVNARVVYQGF